MSVFKGTLPTFRRLAPFLLSHHPECSLFGDDTYELFGKRFCLGCSITYPTAIAAALIILLTGAYGNFPEPLFHQSVLLLVSITLGLFQLIKYFRFHGKKNYRILVKFSLGLAIGGMAVWALTMPVFFPFRIVILVIFMMLIMFTGSSRILYIRGICAGCVYHGDWDICYGFRKLNSYHAFRNVKGRRLTRLIFDRERKKDAGHLTKPPGGLDDEEPPLKDDCRWLYHEEGYRIPWLPLTGLEVERLEDIRCK